MLVSVKGTFKNGVAQPAEPIEGREGQRVIITFVDEAAPASKWEPTAEEIKAGYDELTRLLDECSVDTGITDLAHQHDHYVHGTPKREQ